MNRIRRTSLGILVTLLMAVPFAAQAASSCTWYNWSNCSFDAATNTVFSAITWN